MEEILRIKRDSNFYLKGSLISTQNVGNINEYLIQLLGIYTVLDEGITLSELIHSFYGLKEFISNYFSEEYEVARAFSTATKLQNPKSKIVLFKSFRSESDDFMDDEEYIYILPEVKFEESKEEDPLIVKVGDLPVVIDENISFSNEEFSFNKKVKFTLLDILTCVFEELVEKIKDSRELAV